MISHNKGTDILLIVNDEEVINIFANITKNFYITIKYAKNTIEFIDLIKNEDFHCVICDLDLLYNYEGIFIANIFSTLMKLRNLSSETILLTNNQFSNNKLITSSFNGILEKNSSAIYDFLQKKFPFQIFKNDILFTSHEKGGMNVN